MGGGTTVHEAIRLGANVVGADVDPVPVLQTRAALRLSDGGQKRAIFESLFQALRDALAASYRTSCPQCGDTAEAQFILHGLRRRCGCGEAIFVDSLTLREGGPGSQVTLSTAGGLAHTEQHAERRVTVDVARILTKGQAACATCGAAFEDVLDEPFPQRYVPLVVVGSCPKHAAFFKSADAADRERIERATATAVRADLGDFGSFAVPGGPKSNDLLRKGVVSFLDLFTARQLRYLATALQILPSFPSHDRLWLALLVSTSLEFNCLLCGYKGGDARRPGAIRHVFSHHAYSFPYTALENNPVFPFSTSGTLRRLFADRIERASRWAVAPVERRIAEGRVTSVTIAGEVDGGEEVPAFEALQSGSRRFVLVQADARHLAVPDNAVDHVVTDPPYFDSVQYSDLSSFFRVWLARLLPDEADWAYDRSASVVVEGKHQAFGRYATAPGAIWRECARVLKRPSGRLVFTFHHWSPQAWAELTISLKRGGFVLVNCYVVASENPISVHIRGLKALKHDVVLVLAPRDAGAHGEAWPKPERFDAQSSDGFCRACAEALGWLLSSDVAEETILPLWGRLLCNVAGRDR
ncbi:MAG: hypothetical protein HYU88_13290 [Chloroflexi bacterium]|nr:hypothetical protein [Chloroflexota bacterium]